MLNAFAVSDRISNIIAFYEIGKLALKDKQLMKKYINEKRDWDFLIVKTHDNLPETERWLNKEHRDFLLSKEGEKYRRKLVNKNAKFSINALKMQAVVMMHSYIEIVMAEIISMILEKDENVLKRIYYEKNDLPFDVADLLNNKKSIIKMLVDKESNRFLFLSMEKKVQYYKKYLDMDILNWSDFPHFSTDLLKIDKLRHEIVHSNKNAKVDSLYGMAFYLGHFSDWLLKTAKQKYDINISWKHPLKKINKIRESEV